MNASAAGHPLFDPSSRYNRLRAGFAPGDKLRGFFHLLEATEKRSLCASASAPPSAPLVLPFAGGEMLAAGSARGGQALIPSLGAVGRLAKTATAPLFALVDHQALQATPGGEHGRTGALPDAACDPLVRLSSDDLQTELVVQPELVAQAFSKGVRFTGPTRVAPCDRVSERPGPRVLPAEAWVQSSSGELAIEVHSPAVAGRQCRLLLISPAVQCRLRRLMKKPPPSTSQFSPEEIDDLAAMILDASVLEERLEAARLLSALPEMDAVGDEQGRVVFRERVEAPEALPADLLLAVAAGERVRAEPEAPSPDRGGRVVSQLSWSTTVQPATPPGFEGLADSGETTFSAGEASSAPSPCEILHEAAAGARSLESLGEGVQGEFFALPEQLVQALNERLAGAADEPARGFAEFVKKHDPLGIAWTDNANSAVVETQPLWWTRLLEAPQRIVWKPLGGESSLAAASAAAAVADGVLLFGRDGKEIARLPGSGNSVELDGELRERVASEGDICWQATSAGALVARGCFRIVPPADAIMAWEWLGRGFLARSGASRDVSAAAHLFALHCYDASLELLLRLSRENLSPPRRFLLERAIASVYVAVAGGAGGPRRLPSPEGEWALLLARRHLEAAYRCLGFSPQFAGA